MADPRAFGDALTGQLRAAYLEAVDATLKLISVDALEALVLRGDRREITLLVEQALAQGFVPSSLKYVQAMMAASIAAGASVAAAGAGLDILSPRVLDLIRQAGGRRITALSQEAVAAVMATIAEGTRRGVGAAKIARQIRSSIGLLPAHARALVNYAVTQDELVDEGKLSPSRGAKNVETYHRRLLAYRADMISRTESLMAAHAGLVEGWKANQDHGFLARDALMEWVTTEDDRACARCVPMDGQRVKVKGGIFEATVKGFPEGMKDWGTSPGSRAKRKSGIKPGTPGGDWREEDLDGRVVELRKPIRVAHPPLHPNCRCTLVLVSPRGVEQSGSSPGS